MSLVLLGWFACWKSEIRPKGPKVWDLGPTEGAVRCLLDGRCLGHGLQRDNAGWSRREATRKRFGCGDSVDPTPVGD